MDDWEDNDVDESVPNISIAAKKKWDDEDVDLNQVKDAWDEESSEEEEEKVVKEDPNKKKKVSIAQRIAEREQKKTGKQYDNDEELDYAERKRREAQAILEADLENAEELFEGLIIKDKTEGVPIKGNETIIKEVASPLDKINPQTKEEFDEFSTLLIERIKKHEKHKLYTNFVAGFVRDLCSNLKDVDIRKISNTLTLLAAEKSKDAQKTKKKGNTKPTLAKEGNILDVKNYEDIGYEDDYYGYDDDFM